MDILLNYKMKKSPCKGQERKEKMEGMIYDGTRVRAYESLKALCGYAGETPEWCDALWTKLLEDEELYGELLYYMKNNTLLDRMRREGCTLTDLFARQMDQSGGKAGGYGQEDHCRMVDMVLRAFADMARRNREGK